MKTAQQITVSNILTGLCTGSRRTTGCFLVLPPGVMLTGCFGVTVGLTGDDTVSMTLTIHQIFKFNIKKINSQNFQKRHFFLKNLKMHFAGREIFIQSLK